MTLLYERAGRNRSSQGTHVGGVLRMIAKYVVHSPPQEVEKISRWAAMLSLQYSGMTEKNQRAVSAALRPDHDAKLLALPDALLAAAERLIDASPRQAACLAWRATALAFLIRVPLREANIIGLRLNRHLQRDEPRRRGLHAIHIPAEETKTGQPLMRPIPAALDRMLQHWITRFRPLIATPGNQFLFPAFDRGDGHINRQGFRKAISEVTHRHVGVRLSPHQFRHLAGKRMLTAHPGEYESARQLLGHSRLETTVKHYTGTEMEVTAARFDALITAVPQRKPKTRPKRPAVATAGKQNAKPHDSQSNNDQHDAPKAGRRRPRCDPEGSR
jgi:integrase